MPEEIERKDGEKPVQPRKGPRRWRKRALGVLVGSACVVLTAFLVLWILYGTGTIDSYVKGQFVEAFDEMNISMKTGKFTVEVSPLTMRIENAVFTNKTNGKVLGSIRNARFRLSVLDLFALSTERNVNVDEADIYGLDVRFDVDEKGHSNFDGVEFLPPKNRIKFQYAAARVSIRDSAFHFGNVTRKISGNAEDLAITLNPAGSGNSSTEINYRFDLATSKAEFSYGEKKIDPISVRGLGILKETGLDIESLTINSPVGSSTLAGTVNDWKSPKYDLTIASDLDLTQISRIFPMGTAISGTGGFRGKVKGQGEKYRIEGQVTSESLAAENVRLKALELNAVADGEGALYNASGKAIADMLTFGDFRLNYPQITGSIRGTGTDFRWFGALEAAAMESPLGTVGGLYINDAAAEYRDNRLLMNFAGVRARKFTSEEAYLENITAPSIRIVDANGVATATVNTAAASRLDSQGATLSDLTLNDLRVVDRPAETDIDARSVRARKVTKDDTRLTDVAAENVKVNRRNGESRIKADRITAEQTNTESARIGRIEADAVAIEDGKAGTRIDSPSVRVARVETDAAVLADLNIAGVRLSVKNGVVEGSTADFAPGTVDLKNNGRLENVAVARPVFVLEPSGRYRASFDLTLGGGLLGTVDLGAARASVVANSDEITLTDFSGELMQGSAKGEAVIAMKDSGRSEINAEFTELDIAKVLAIGSGNVLPLEGKTSGSANVSFPGSNFRKASGQMVATVTATAGNEQNGFVPVSGGLTASAAEGLVTLSDGRLTSSKSLFLADGDLDLSGNNSRLNLSVKSSDAREIERLVRIFDIAPALKKQMDSLDGHFAGNFTFEGDLTGSLEEPYLSGSASLGSLTARSRDLGALSAKFELAPFGLTVTEGKLQESDGGNILFSAVIPAGGTNNNSVAARLDRFNIGTLLTAVPINGLPSSLTDLQSKTSGDLDLGGLPDDMRGTATLTAEAGTLNGETFDSLETSASFNGTLVKIDKFNAKFGAGDLVADGTYRTDLRSFDGRLRATDVPASRLLAFLPKDSRIPAAEGSISLNATASGLVDDTSSYQITFSGTGNGIVVNNNSFGQISFSGRTSNSILNATFTSHAGGREQLITAEANLGDEKVPFKAVSTFTDAPLGPYIAIFRKPDPDKVDLGGSATGVIALEGNLVDTEKNAFTTSLLKGNAILDKFTLSIGETDLQATETVRMAFDLNRVTIDNARFSGGGTNLTVNGTKAFTDNAVNDLALNGSMDLRVLNAISSNFFFAGVANVEVSLSGVNKDARLNGRAQMDRGSVATFIGTERITLEGLKGCILFNTTQVQIGCNTTRDEPNEIVGRLGGGDVIISGALLLSNDLLINEMRLDVEGKNITAPLPVDFRTTGNAQLVISGTRDERTGQFEALVSGNFFARRSTYTRDIDLADFIGGRRDTSLSKSSDDSSILAATRLDIRIYGRDALIVRNNIADLTASADLRVTGDIETPRISGQITANRGTIYFRDDQYEVQRGVLSFPPNTTIEPVISLQAETVIAGYQVFVGLGGNLTDTDSLSATLRSNPSLPQADVVSLITTGSLTNTGTGIPTYAQSGLNTAAEILTDEIINKPISRATDKLFGLNRFNLDPIVSGERGNPTARLTVGRQINRNLLVTYSTNLSQDQNQVLALEYRVSNRLSFVAQYEQRALSNVTRKRNTFSFEIRLRKRF